MTPAHRHHLALTRRAYHRACEVHRGDPTLEHTFAVRVAFAALTVARSPSP